MDEVEELQNHIKRLNKTIEKLNKENLAFKMVLSGVKPVEYYHEEEKHKNKPDLLDYKSLYSDSQKALSTLKSLIKRYKDVTGISIHRVMDSHYKKQKERVNQ